MNLFLIYLGILCYFYRNVLTAPTLMQPADSIHLFRHDDVRRWNSMENRFFWNDRTFRWSNGQVPYELSSEYSTSDIDIILKAMKEWETKTCVRFVPRQLTDNSYVEITPNDGTSSYCYSFVGRQGGKQFMKMFGECMRHGAMIHELGHVIGFNHEHQRPDRDNYIIVHFENINPAYRYAFDRHEYGVVDTMGTTYDFSSVMHYPFYAFSDDENRPSMTLKNGSIDEIYREAEFLSEVDVYKTQLYYDNCSVNDLNSSTTLTTSTVNNGRLTLSSLLFVLMCVKLTQIVTLL